MNSRQQFEARFPPPKDVTWDELRRSYVSSKTSVFMYQALWLGWSESRGCKGTMPAPAPETERRYRCGSSTHSYSREQLLGAGWTEDNILRYCVAVDVPKVPSAEDARLHKIRNACTAINGKVEKYNVSIDCSAAMRTVIEAMIDAGYHL